MEQKFGGDIGQVAGRDVKNNAAQANVNIHLHNGAESKRYISDRQRRAIAAKIYDLEATTGVEKLIVYRRLMTRFNFQSMDQMPRDLYERVTRYLDGWIRNGSADQTAPSVAQQEFGRPMSEAPRPPEPTDSQAAAVAQTALSATLGGAAAVPRQPPKRRTSPAVVSLGITASIVFAGALYVATNRADVSAQIPPAETSPHCEYAGQRYTVGSIVRQEGIRQKCDAAPGRSAAWQPVTASGRR